MKKLILFFIIGLTFAACKDKELTGDDLIRHKMREAIKNSEWGDDGRFLYSEKKYYLNANVSLDSIKNTFRYKSFQDNLKFWKNQEKQTLEKMESAEDCLDLAFADGITCGEYLEYVTSTIEYYENEFNQVNNNYTNNNYVLVSTLMGNELINILEAYFNSSCELIFINDTFINK